MAKKKTSSDDTERTVYMFFDSDEDPKKRARSYRDIAIAGKCAPEGVIVDVLGDSEDLKFHSDKNGTIEVVAVANDKVVGRLVNPDPDPEDSEINDLVKKLCKK